MGQSVENKSGIKNKDTSTRKKFSRMFRLIGLSIVILLCVRNSTLIGKPWVEDRIKAYKSVQEMREYLNSLSEEEAHKLMIEQTQKILKEKE